MHMVRGTMKILIATPTTPYGGIHPDCFKAIYGLDPAGHQLVYDYVSGYDCAAARNRIAKQAVDEGADFVLMVDADTILPHDAIGLLTEIPVDVVSGCCRIFDGRINATKLGEFDYTDFYTVEDMDALRDSGVKRELVHGCGFAATMVRTEVFGRIEYPYFKWTEYPSGAHLSEDLGFCETCNGLGIQIHVDPRVRCGHAIRRTEWC